MCSPFTVLQPWQLLLVTLAGWINRQQQDVIAYIQEENRILKNRLKGKVLGRKARLYFLEG